MRRAAGCRASHPAQVGRDRDAHHLREQRRHRVADERRDLLLGALEPEVVLERLEPRAFAQRDVPVLGRVREHAAREAVEPRGDRRAGRVGVQAPVDVAVSNAVGALLVTLDAEVHGQALEPLARRDQAQALQVLLGQPHPVVQRVARARAVGRRRREVANRIPNRPKGPLLVRRRGRVEGRHVGRAPAEAQHATAPLRHPVVRGVDERGAVEVTAVSQRRAEPLQHLPTALPEEAGHVLHDEHARTDLADEPPEGEDQIVAGVFILPATLNREPLTWRTAHDEVDGDRLVSDAPPEGLSGERPHVRAEHGVLEIQLVVLYRDLPRVHRTDHLEPGAHQAHGEPPGAGKQVDSSER